MRTILSGDGLAISELRTKYVPLCDVVTFFDAPHGNKGHQVWVKRSTGKPIALPSGPLRPQVERQVTELNLALEHLRS